MKGLDTNNMSRFGDVKVYKKDSTFERTNEFNAPIQVLDIRSEIKLDYSPIRFVRSCCTACRNSAFPWKMGKETDGIDNECTAVKSRELRRPRAKNALVEGECFQNTHFTPCFHSPCTLPADTVHKRCLLVSFG